MQMHTSERFNIIKRLFWTVLAVSSIFGVNTFWFAYSRLQLQDLTGEIENSAALRQSLFIDNKLYQSGWKEELKVCAKISSSSCDSAVSSLLVFRNRNDDYITVLKQLFGSKPLNNTAIRDLVGLNQEIDKLFADGFGLSLSEAKHKGIFNASSYIKEVEKSQSLNLSSLLLYCQDIENRSRHTLISMKSLISSTAGAYRSFSSSEYYIMRLFWIIAILELVAFSLVSFIDIWNNNVSDRSDL